MTQIKVEVEGLNKLLAQLREIDGDDVVLDAITDVVTDTHALAVSGIQRGPKTGARYRRGGVVHQASAPGQYPASDTGRLASNVRFELPTPSNMTGRVGTNIAYGPYLEFGTSRMAARPWLLPSFERAKIGVERELKAKLEGRL
jgi:phage gpG-like protein